MSKKKRFILIVLYVIFLIILIEGSARLTFVLLSPDSQWEDADYNWRRWWVNRHKNTGKEIFYSFDIHDSSKGWISKPNIRDMKVFSNKVLNTNSKGLRGNKEYSYEKTPNKVRILILGDSATFGDEVSDNETYAYYLQKMLPNIEVINMGVHGYGHDQMLLLLREEGIKYKPDIVILGFIHLDMDRNLLQFRDYAKPKFVLDNGELKLTGTPVPRPEDILKWDWAMPRTFQIFSILRHRFKKSSGLLKKEREEITTAILTEFMETVNSIHAISIFVYMPYGNEITDTTPLTQGEKFFFDMCGKKQKVRCFSTRPYFTKEIAEGKIFKLHGHWGPEGHLTIAEAIKRFLIDGKYVVLPQLHGNSAITKP